MYGPKGIGVLYARRGLNLSAQIFGGGHENGLRSGTLNVPGIAGFGEACALASEEMETRAARITAMRDRLAAALAKAGGMRINGSMEHRLPGNLNVSFTGVDGDALLSAIPEIAVSAGSACTSGADSSYVLEALGTPPEFLQCAVRFGIGRSNTEEEIVYAAERVCTAVAQLRALSPVSMGRG
jgi:cysteine desulfurase